MRQGLEDSPATQTEAGEDSPLPQSLTKRPSNTKESFTKSTTLDGGVWWSLRICVDALLYFMYEE